MAATLEQSSPIDAVITWVDGSDPVHAAKLHDYLASIGGVRPRGANPARFHHSGELDYCVTSLLKFAPWLRRIYIVTDNQVPTLMQVLKATEYEDRVVIVDHKTIFAGYEQYLPTFNSSSILAMLWRIPGLAENFLFLNDDFALIRPVHPEDFFREDKVVLRGEWRIHLERLWHKRFEYWIKHLFYKGARARMERAGYLGRQAMSAKLVGFSKKYFQLEHNPHSWRRSAFSDFFAENPSVLDFSVSFKLRSPHQYVVEALAAHLEFRRAGALVDNKLKTMQLKPADQAAIRIKRKLQQMNSNSSYAFVCVQNIESASEVAQRMVFDWMDGRIGRLTDVIKSEPVNNS